MSHPSERLIRDIPDFPKPGIVFKDLTPLFRDPDAFAHAMRDLEAMVDWTGVEAVVGIEARGFIVGTHIASSRNLGFVPIRKPGKLPAKTIEESYDLEYGTDTLEMHADSFHPGEKVVLVDDLLATGGSAAAAVRLIERCGGEVAATAFLVELAFLSGRECLNGVTVHSLIHVTTA